MKGTFPISKYKVYISEANTLQEAEEMAPDDVDVQEGTQGGFFYEQEGDSGGVDDDTHDSDASGGEEGLSSEAELEFGGYEFEALEEPKGVALQELGVDEGDLLYVNHPDGDYIAEVDDVDVGYSDWEVTFGGGSYSLREDTTSSPIGLVTEMPNPAAGEEVIPIDDTDELAEGDVIMWEDDGGFEHYGVVDLTGANNVSTESGTGMPISDVEGKVEMQDPTEMYDIPSAPDEVEADVDPQDAIEFQNNLAEALEAGDATSLPAYKYMTFAGSITDPELVKDAYESVLANDGNKTQKERLERRLRGMGIDPDEMKSVAPDEVPPVRQDTVFSGYDKEQAVAVAASIAQDEFGPTNWESWNDFFDHLTEEEKYEALERSLEDDYKSINHKDPTSKDLTERDFNPSQGNGTIDKGVAAIMSRLPEGSYEEISDLSDTGPFNTYCAQFLKSAEDRRKFYKNEDVFDTKIFKVQFGNYSDEQRTEQMGNIHSTSTTSRNTMSQRAMLWGMMGGEEAENINGYNNGFPIAPIEPTEDFREAVEYNQQKIQDHIAKEPDNLPGHIQGNLNHDGTITVYRGVKDKITGFSAAGSWSTDVDVASGMFDGQGIMKADIKPEDIFVANGINFYKHASENEVTVLGNNIAEKVEVMSGDPIDFDELDVEKMAKTGSFVITTDPEEIEAAIFDDMYDSGMFTEHRLVDGEKVPIEEVAESEETGEEQPEEKSGAIDRLATEIAQSASQRLSKTLEKEWVKDPSPDAEQMRWRNTDTGEYRYQENKPGGGGEGETQQGTFGDFGDADEEYNIQSDFGREVANAVGRDDTDVVDEIAANEWMSLAGQIEDTDLLVDALEPIQDHGTKTARERIRRRLRGLGWESDEIDDALSDDGEETTSHEEWQEQYDPGRVEDTMSLSAAGASEGVGSENMEVHKLEDGTEAYVMQMPEDAMHSDKIDRQMVAYEVTRALGGAAPPHKYWEETVETNYGEKTALSYAAREADGKERWEAPNSWKANADPDEVAEEMAIQLIAGNVDAHGENVFLNEDGELSFIDLDHSAGALDDDKAAESHNNHYQRAMVHFKAGLQDIYEQAENVSSMEEALDSNEVEQMIRHHASIKAEELQGDEEAFERMAEYDEEMAENIRHNVELLMEGEI